MTGKTTFQEYASIRSEALMLQGRNTTAYHYDVAIKKFTKIIGFVPIRKISSEHIMRLDEAIRAQGVMENTAMYYMRTLKAIYNHAVKVGFVKDNEPFKYVKSGVAKTKKRAITESQIRKIYQMELDKPKLVFARDMFILSFLLRGIAPVDMMKLKKSNIVNGCVLVYKRSKTKKDLKIKIEDKAKAIIKKYEVKDNDRLLPLDENQIKYININLKKVGEKAGIDFPLSLYVARHTWATLSRFHNVPISVISSGMGHSNEQITQVYLSEIETSVVDRYNKKLIDSVFR